MRFLLAWQKVAPDHQMEGPESVRAIIEQLEGSKRRRRHGKANSCRAVWSNTIRHGSMRCVLSGEVVWARLTPLGAFGGTTENGANARVALRPVRNTPIALLRRKNFAIWSSVFPQPAPTTNSNFQPPRRRSTTIWRRAAHRSSLTLSRARNCCAARLKNRWPNWWRMAWLSPTVSPDLRALLTPGSRKTQAAARRKHRQPVYEMVERRRWSHPATRTAIATRLLKRLRAARPEEVALALLKRYGVVFKRLLEREGIAMPWRVLLRIYHRLEARGEIRGGRFVAGISGEQFALPEAVGMLRAIRRAGAQESLISVSAADPLNLVGIIIPGSRITLTQATAFSIRTAHRSPPSNQARHDFWLS